MTEQSKGLYQLSGMMSIEDIKRKLNFILSRISDRLDKMEGLRGTPTFYKTAFNFGPSLTVGQVLKVTSENQAEISSIDVSDVDGAVPDIDSGSSAQININKSLISLVDENDYVVHQFPTQWLEYNCDVFMFTTIESFPTDDNRILSSMNHQIQEDAINGIIEGDGAGNYSAVSILNGNLLVAVYDFDEEVIHEFPLEYCGSISETFGFF